MSELEDFLSRWVQRKHEARQAAEAPEAVPDHAAPNEKNVKPATAEVAAPAVSEPTVDLSALPPIESITAATDIRGYLAPGVPVELTRAALRRAWVADPQVRDFIGIAENQWDFTDPNAIPGFGAFGPLDDVSRLVARVVQLDAQAGDATEPSAVTDATPAPAAGEILDSSTAELVASATVSHPDTGGTRQPMSGADAGENMRRSDGSDAAHKEPDDASHEMESNRRRHGGALPK